MTKKDHKSGSYGDFFSFFPGSSEVIRCICEEQTFVSLTCEQKEFGPGHKTEPNDTFSELN